MENEIMNNVEEIEVYEDVEVGETETRESVGFAKPALLTVAAAGAIFACYKLGKKARKLWDKHKAKKEAENQGNVIVIPKED